MTGRFYAGLDLGQAQDYSALSIVEGIKTPDKPRYDLRHLERFPLGTLYPAIVNCTRERLSDKRLRDKVQLVVDATGVGRPVVDMLNEAGLSPIGVTITGGNEVTPDPVLAAYRVPKRDLVSTLQVLLQSKRLRIDENSPQAQTLVKELLSFQVKIDLKTAHDSYGAWREGAHDDLVLSVALAVWFAEQYGGPMILFEI